MYPDVLVAADFDIPKSSFDVVILEFAAGTRPHCIRQELRRKIPQSGGKSPVALERRKCCVNRIAGSLDMICEFLLVPKYVEEFVAVIINFLTIMRRHLLTCSGYPNECQQMVAESAIVSRQCAMPKKRPNSTEGK